MALPACSHCGRTDPRRMIGLMTLWFGPFVDMQPDFGYFHLCPTCYRRHVKPHLDEVQGRLAELHPMTHNPALDDDPAEHGPADAPGNGDETHGATGAGTDASAHAPAHAQADAGDTVAAGGGKGGVGDGGTEQAGRGPSTP